MICVDVPARAGIFITGVIEVQQDLQAETGESIEEWCDGRLQEFNEGAGVRYRERSQIKIQNKGHIKKRIVCQEDARIERLRQKGRLAVDAL